MASLLCLHKSPNICLALDDLVRGPPGTRAPGIVEVNVAITGECFCGEIKYQVDGKLRDAQSCHCSRCRKAFSSQASASAMVEPGDFKWLSGEGLLTSYVGEHGYGLRFCKVCGSTLCTICNGEVYHVSLGCVNGNPEIEIGKHVFVGSKATWEVIPDGVVQFQEGPSQEA